MSGEKTIQIPPLAGACSLSDAQRQGQSVAEASRRLRRLAYAKQRLAHLAAAHLNATPEWEVKAALALHCWYDAEHATWLRRRILELREPQVRLEEVPDARLAAAFDEALHSTDTAELLTAIYGVIRPLQLESAERYLAQTNPLADHPTCRLLKLLCVEDREAAEWGRAALAAVSDSDEVSARCSAWAAHLRAYFAAAGGLDGSQAAAQIVLPPPRATGKFSPGIIPQRDARFRGLFDPSTPADAVYLDDSRPADERNLALIFKRVREMDVPEVLAGIIAETPDRPWVYYADLFRQLWDEARHALLGEVALRARGLDWTRLPVNVTFSYKLARHCSPRERHILLYAIEQSLMPARRGKRYEWEVACEAGEPLMTTFQDFDWADEVLHVEIARRQLRPDLKGGLTEARRRADRLWQRIARALEREPMPDDAPPPDWWEKFAESALGHPVALAPQTDVKDWRPLSA